MLTGKWKRRLYGLHRWIGLIVALQLLLWSVGGFIFNILDIDMVRGHNERREQAPAAIGATNAIVGPSTVLAALRNSGEQGEVHAMHLRVQGERLLYEVRRDGKVFARFDAQSVEQLPIITLEEARAVARADFLPEADILSAELLQGDPPTEIRGREMPVYRVVFDHPRATHIYISPTSGEVIARRNAPWRLFDFFWMLHTMDYRGRDDFNHGLLTFFSLLAVVTSLSGILLWGIRLPRLWRRRRGAA